MMVQQEKEKSDPQVTQQVQEFAKGSGIVEEKMKEAEPDLDKARLLREVNDKIRYWVSQWIDNRGQVLLELKEFAKCQSDFKETELKNWVIVEVNKLKRIEEEQKEKTKKKTEDTDDILMNYLKCIKDKEWGEASELLVRHILNDNYMFTTKDDNKSEIWIYRNGIYIPQGRSEIKEILRKLLGKFYSTFVYNIVIAKIEPDTFIEASKFFGTNYKYEVPLQNGVLNIITKEIKPFNPNKIFFNKLPVTYNPDAKCIMIDKFLSDVLANSEDKKVFYELGGFCLLKEYTFEKAFMFVGNGRNGKGKSIELLKRVFGGENCYSLPLAALETSNPDVHQLFGKMINMAGDISSTDLKDTTMFKGLTGRDPITTKRKFLNAITFENFAKFIFACNELPMVYDTSKGFWDRWVLLEFPYYFANKDEYEKAREEEKRLWKLRDEDIIQKITTPEELSGLLNEFLKGFERLLIQRRFSSTKGSDEVKNEWIRKSNSFMAFVMDKIEEDYDGFITKKEVRKRYLEYCKEHKVSGKNDYVIRKVLQEMFGVTEDRIQTGDLFGKDYQSYVWSGIKWKR